MKKIVAVTSCPTGIAHTYMAAEMLEKTANAMHVEIKVETNGAIGIENRLTPLDIQACDAVIIAADTHVEMERFEGKPLIEVSVSKAIKEPKELIQMALSAYLDIYKHTL